MPSSVQAHADPARLTTCSHWLCFFSPDPLLSALGDPGIPFLRPPFAGEVFFCDLLPGEAQELPQLKSFPLASLPPNPPPARAPPPPPAARARRSAPGASARGLASLLVTSELPLARALAAMDHGGPFPEARKRTRTRKRTSEAGGPAFGVVLFFFLFFFGRRKNM